MCKKYIYKHQYRLPVYCTNCTLQYLALRVQVEELFPTLHFVYMLYVCTENRRPDTTIISFHSVNFMSLTRFFIYKVEIKHNMLFGKRHVNLIRPVDAITF